MNSQIGLFQIAVLGLMEECDLRSRLDGVRQRGAVKGS